MTPLLRPEVVTPEQHELIIGKGHESGGLEWGSPLVWALVFLLAIMALLLIQVLRKFGGSGHVACLFVLSGGLMICPTTSAHADG